MRSTSFDAWTRLFRQRRLLQRCCRYHGSLFTGDAAEALGHMDEARAAYERAAVLYPMAHSPRLALSQMAAREGDTIAASQTLELVVSEHGPGTRR